MCKSHMWTLRLIDEGFEPMIGIKVQKWLDFLFFVDLDRFVYFNNFLSSCLHNSYNIFIDSIGFIGSFFYPWLGHNLRAVAIRYCALCRAPHRNFGIKQAT